MSTLSSPLTNFTLSFIYNSRYMFSPFPHIKPNAMDVLLPQWILASLPIARAQEFYRSPAAQSASADQFQLVAELCLQEGYISTLHESMIVFMPVSIVGKI